MTQHVTFRASPALLHRIDGLAEARKSSRTAVIKAAILEATVPEHATAIADEHEVLALLTEAARSGSVPAMKALLAYHRGRAKQPDGARDVFDELDELAPAALPSGAQRGCMSLAPSPWWLAYCARRARLNPRGRRGHGSWTAIASHERR